MHHEFHLRVGVSTLQMWFLLHFDDQWFLCIFLGSLWLCLALRTWHRLASWEVEFSEVVVGLRGIVGELHFGGSLLLLLLTLHMFFKALLALLVAILIMLFR